MYLCVLCPARTQKGGRLPAMVVAGCLNGLRCQRFGWRVGTLWPAPTVCSRRRGVFAACSHSGACCAAFATTSAVSGLLLCLPPAAATTPYHSSDYQPRTTIQLLLITRIAHATSCTVRILGVYRMRVLEGSVPSYIRVCGVCGGCRHCQPAWPVEISCNGLGRPAGRLAQAPIAPVCGLHAVYS
jgi:hypothetical protein